MTDVDDEHTQPVSVNHVHDAVAADPVRVATCQRTDQPLALKEIAFKIVQGLGDPLIESGFPLSPTALRAHPRQAR